MAEGEPSSEVDKGILNDDARFKIIEL